MNKGISRFLSLSFLALTVAACSGGGSDDSEPTNQKPTADAGQDLTVDEQTEVTVEGSGSDSDGSVSSYSWAQTSGEAVELAAADTANLTFTAPVAKTELTLEFELIVEDNEGATAKDTVQVVVSPVNEEKLTMRGFATEEPIANAEISITVFGQDFSTTAGSDGQYELTIEFDEDADTDNEFAILSAKGVGAQGFVSLKSAIGSVSALVDSAGSDSVVTSDEYLPLEISETATAMLALATINNGNQLPADRATYQASLKNYSGYDIVSLAAGIKLIVEQSDTNPEFELPAGTATTWELASSEFMAREFLAEIKDSYGSDFNTASSTIIEQLRNRNTYSEQPSFYAPLTGALNYAAQKIDFDNNQYLDETVVQGAYATIVDGKINAELEEKTITESAVMKDVGGFDAQFIKHKVYSSKEYDLVQSFATFDLVIVRTIGYYHYESSLYPNYYPDEPFDTSGLALMAKTLKPAELSETPGTMMLPLNAEMLHELVTYNTSYGDLYNDITKEAGSFTLNENGTVTDTHSELGSGSWGINNNSNLVLNLANAVITIEKYRDDFVGVTINAIGGDFLGFITGYTGKRNQSTLWTEEEVIGFYDLPYEITRDELSFVLHLKAGGAGDWIRGHDNNGNGIAEADEYKKDPLLWHLEDGLLIVERYTDLSFNGCLPDAGNPDCFLLNRREIDLFKIEEDRVYVTNNHKFNYHPLFEGEVSEELKEVWSFEMLSTRYWNKYSEFPLELDL
ncbi:PKD domain-containing protein [Kangiella shandongensis]|uniref:PKD domain-containing protein n=1 Tax=Kangiella shandongensis TaxID=2763258 RepID=UPI001CBF890B|nr:hypothetical protein [Kangiella shandongensis]